jgi:FkbM family methyltransferase
MLDVGANVGYMTALAARAAGSEGLVIAVEPAPDNLALLRANVWLNRLENVRVLPIAAWSRRDLLPLRFNPDNRGDDQVGASGAPDPASARLVPAAPLDDLLGGLSVDVVKVDTQGSDHEVIEGLSATLDASPEAVILAEFWLDGLAERGIDPRHVLRGYRGKGLSIALLREDGQARAASDDEVVAACEAWEGRFVNLVLRRAD